MVLRTKLGGPRVGIRQARSAIRTRLAVSAESVEHHACASSDPLATDYAAVAETKLKGLPPTRTRVHGPNEPVAKLPAVDQMLPSLVEEFGEAEPAGEIRACADAILSEFDDVPIRSFVLTLPSGASATACGNRLRGVRLSASVRGLRHQRFPP